MRRIVFVFLLFLVSCCSREVIVDDEFRSDIDYINSVVWGHLAADTSYDFSAMTYEDYLKLLQENEMISGRGVTAKVRMADKYNFRPGNETFVITLYYRTGNTIISDNAEPGRNDTIFPFHASPSEEYLKLISERILE
jgi:hypothetical protein